MKWAEGSTPSFPDEYRHLEIYLYDFFEAQTYPHFYDHRRMSAKWRDAQRAISKVYVTLKLGLEYQKATSGF